MFRFVEYGSQPGFAEYGSQPGFVEYGSQPDHECTHLRNPAKRAFEQMQNMHANATAECIDIATGETQGSLTKRTVIDVEGTCVTIDNLPTALGMTSKRAMEHLHRDYKTYAIANMIPNYILLHKDPIAKKGRRCIAFAPAHHVLGFLRARRSASANALVTRINAEIAKKTQATQLETTEAALQEATTERDANAERAEEAEREKTVADAARVEAERLRVEAEKEKAAAEQHAEDETDRANAECEQRVAESREHEKEVMRLNKQIEVFRSLPKQNQIEYFGSESAYAKTAALPVADIRGSCKRHQDADDMKEDLIHDLKELLQKMGIHVMPNFTAAISQSINFLHGKVQNHQFQEMGNVGRLALMGIDNVKDIKYLRTIMKGMLAATHKLEKVNGHLREFRARLGMALEEYTLGEKTQEQMYRSTDRSFKLLDSWLLEIIADNNIGDAAGQFGHNSGMYNAKEMHERLCEKNKLNLQLNSVAYSYYVDGTKGPVYSMTLLHCGKSTEEKEQWQAICDMMIADDTLVWSADETVDERKERREKVLALCRSHLDVKYQGTLSEKGISGIDSYLRHVLYGERMVLSMHGNGDFGRIYGQFSDKMDQFIKSCRSRAVQEGYCKGITIREFTSKRNRLSGLSRKREREATGEVVHTRMGRLPAPRDDDDIKKEVDTLHFSLPAICNVHEMDKLRSVAPTPAHTFVVRCIQLLGKRVTSVFKYLKKHFTKDSNAWYRVKRHRGYLGNESDERASFVTDMGHFVDTWESNKPKQPRGFRADKATVKEQPAGSIRFSLSHPYYASNSKFTMKDLQVLREVEVLPIDTFSTRCKQILGDKCATCLLSRFANKWRIMDDDADEWFLVRCSPRYNGDAQKEREAFVADMRVRLEAWQASEHEVDTNAKKRKVMTSGLDVGTNFMAQTSHQAPRALPYVLSPS